MIRQIVYILVIFTYSSVSAKTYYVATDGNDNWPGTLEQPWATWERAFETASRPGDTTYIRGGVYFTDRTSGSDNIAGTLERPICFFAYPGERPILDGRNCTEAKVGVMFQHVDHVKLKGLTVRNFYQVDYYQQDAVGIYFYKSGHITIEQCTTHDIGYRGFYFFAPDSLFVYNCDSYNIVDSLSVTPGNAGDGFIMTGGGDLTDYAIFRGCRAWHVSDDGWDVHTNGYIELDSCWAFDCGGYEAFNWGNGIKLNLSLSQEREKLSRKVTNCLLLYNRGSGLTTNDNGRIPLPMQIYNNTSAWNGTFGNDGFGYTVYPTTSSGELERLRIFRNNLSYANSTAAILATNAASYTHSHNTWDSNVELNSLDFISLDSTGIHGKRKADGSLPDLPGFLELSENSDLIDAGIDIGLSFNSIAPDLGARENNYQPGTGNSYPSVRFISPGRDTVLNSTASVIIRAAASDPDGYVERLELILGEFSTFETDSEPWIFQLDFVPVGRHVIRLIATDNLGARSTSSRLVLTSASGMVNLFPNPNNGIFTIVLDEPLKSKGEILIISLEGKVIRRDSMEQEEISKEFNFSNIEPGYYALVLDGDNRYISMKFIKL